VNSKARARTVAELQGRKAIDSTSTVPITVQAETLSNTVTTVIKLIATGVVTMPVEQNFRFDFAVSVLKADSDFTRSAFRAQFITDFAEVLEILVKRVLSVVYVTIGGDRAKVEVTIAPRSTNNEVETVALAPKLNKLLLDEQSTLHAKETLKHLTAVTLIESERLPTPPSPPITPSNSPVVTDPNSPQDWPPGQIAATVIGSTALFAVLAGITYMALKRRNNSGPQAVLPASVNPVQIREETPTPEDRSEAARGFVWDSQDTGVDSVALAELHPAQSIELAPPPEVNSTINASKPAVNGSPDEHDASEPGQS
jgi:hypothetical protein